MVKEKTKRTFELWTGREDTDCSQLISFSPELVDHCAVRNVETFANLLEKKQLSKNIVFKSPEECF